jgi:hypothetical protein
VDNEFKVSLSYRARSCQKKERKKEGKERKNLKIIATMVDKIFKNHIKLKISSKFWVISDCVSVLFYYQVGIIPFILFYISPSKDNNYIINVAHIIKNSPKPLLSCIYIYILYHTSYSIVAKLCNFQILLL